MSTIDADFAGVDESSNTCAELEVTNLCGERQLGYLQKGVII